MPKIDAPHVLVVDEASGVAGHAHAADVENHGAVLPAQRP
jgi:hypothetical protein